ncbi:YbaK/EbsC family protein [Singulisphaera sp. Ch08]|uniref:YbaK/EbsC family protein n=1 Tax=Singulisphaera sp. Ch08 TaxID=3120278 RepID=A0AAU7C6G0_9BACT
MCIRDYLQSRHVWFETLLHPPAPSSSKLAQTVHVSGRFVAKGVLVSTGGAYVLAVLPATTRIDMERLGQALQGQSLRIATEDEVERVFEDCERGALPPFGRLYGLTTLVDASLSGGSEIVFVGNSRHEGVRMRYRDYEAIETPIRTRFALATSPRQRRNSHRKAG